MTRHPTPPFKAFMRRMMQRIEPRAPFTDPLGKKGWLTPMARPQMHEWRRYDAQLEGWHKLARPLKFTVLADLHVGSHTGDVARLEFIVAEVLSRGADAVLMPGDFVNMQPLGGGRVPPSEIARILAPLTQLCPVVAVFGNHDADYGLAPIREALEGVGIIVLENSATIIDTELGHICVIGLEDEVTGHPDFDKACVEVSNVLGTIVMAHDPLSFSRIRKGPWLTVAGHTHGGQFHAPLIGPIIKANMAPAKYRYGHVEDDDGRQIVVSAGLGTSILPLRRGRPPEVLEIFLNGRD